MHSILRIALATLVTAGFDAQVSFADTGANGQRPVQVPLDLAISPGGKMHGRARIRLHQEPLHTALTKLHRATGVPLLFSPSLIPRDHRVDCDCLDVPVREALARMLAGTGLELVDHAGGIIVARGSPVSVPAPGMRLASDLTDVMPTLPSATTRAEATSPMIQQTGTIIGRVFDRRTLAPIPDVLVTIAGIDRQAPTNGSGQFLFMNVPEGVHQIQAARIGYEASTTAATVRTDETVTVEFHLTEMALSLDEIVVTGTAGQARRREVGNTIVQVDMSKNTDPTAKIDQIFQAAGAGISVTQSSASVGSGARIRLRGTNSVSMGNQPMLFIDGIRMHNNSPPSNTPIDGSGARSSHVHVSPMNDLNPDDIERIEVIKGPAATTLYGTEASAGVIQIFTKRGVTGSPTWSAQMDYGLDQARAFAPEPEPYMRLECCLRTGVRQRLSTSVGGGTDRLRYFVSAGAQNNTGVLPLDEQQQVNVRGNFALQLSDKLHVEYNTGWTQNNMRHTPQGNNSQGLVTIAYRDAASGLGAEWRDRIEETYLWEITNHHNHVVTGLTVRHALTDYISNKLTVGIDQLNVEMRSIRPYGFVFEPNGVVNNGQYSHRSITVDFASNVGLNPLDDLSVTLSSGAQLLRDSEIFVNAYGDRLPGPGVPTVSSGARLLASETRQQVVTGGVFGQVLLGFRDRYFLTAGLRVDGNSAFGTDFGLQPYPKASLSYVISDESFWPERLGGMKLRAAYGHAGRAPGAFDATRTWQPVGFGGAPAFYPNQVGNPALGPERTAELEYGFDAVLLGGRASIEFTRFDQVVHDALMPVAQIPSLGFTSSQLMNVGKVGNKGFELTLTGTVLDASRLGWDVGVQWTQQKNKILDLGDAPETNSIRLGQPVPVMVGTKLFNANEVAPPDFVTDHIFGPREPTTIVGVTSTLRLPYGLQASARGEFMGGHFIAISAISNTTTRHSWPQCEVRAYEYLEAGRDSELTAFETLMCNTAYPGGSYPTIYPADFFRVRELSLSSPLPTRLIGDATITVSARNYWSWHNKEWFFSDPEIFARGGENSGLETTGGTIDESIPPPRMFTISIRTRF